MTNKRSAAPHAGFVGALFLLTSLASSSAQIAPATSGSSWFYSPSHFVPFHQFPISKQQPSAPLKHGLSNHKHGNGVHAEPC